MQFHLLFHRYLQNTQSRVILPSVLSAYNKWKITSLEIKKSYLIEILGKFIVQFPLYKRWILWLKIFFVIFEFTTYNMVPFYVSYILYLIDITICIAMINPVIVISPLFRLQSHKASICICLHGFLYFKLF